MKKLKLLFVFLTIVFTASSQETFPVNGVADIRSNAYAFIHATIVKDAQTTLQNATLLIKDGKILSVGTNLSIPGNFAVIDCSGKYIYPSFIDLFSDYGITAPPAQKGRTERSYQKP